MKTLIALSLVLAVPFLSGCGRNSDARQADTAYGKVDASLSPELQAKQEVVRKVLFGLQTGVLVPGVAIQGRIEPLLDDVGRASRWSFDGSPKGNEVPVVLHFDAKAGGSGAAKAEQQAKRVYVVSGNGDRWNVARK